MLMPTTQIIKTLVRYSRVYTTIYVREAASGKTLVPNVFVFFKYLWYDCTLFDQI